MSFKTWNCIRRCVQMYKWWEPVEAFTLCGRNWGKQSGSGDKAPPFISHFLTSWNHFYFVLFHICSCTSAPHKPELKRENRSVKDHVQNNKQHLSAGITFRYSVSLSWVHEAVFVMCMTVLHWHLFHLLWVGIKNTDTFSYMLHETRAPFSCEKLWKLWKLWFPLLYSLQESTFTDLRFECGYKRHSEFWSQCSVCLWWPSFTTRQAHSAQECN